MRRLAVIGGSGAERLVSGRDYVPETVNTKWGEPSAPILRCKISGNECLFLGRHGAAGQIPPHRVNYRANVQALADLGADCIVATNAVGAIDPNLKPGSLVIPEQLIDYTWGRQHTYFEGDQDIDFVDFTRPYDENIRQLLISAAVAANIPVASGGVYGVTQGPRLETAAEIDRLERDGCTLVGMTSMPEAGLARELGIPYASCCFVVNAAAGRSDADIHGEIYSNLEAAGELAAALIEAVAARL